MAIMISINNNTQSVGVDGSLYVDASTTVNGSLTVNNDCNIGGYLCNRMKIIDISNNTTLSFYQLNNSVISFNGGNTINLGANIPGLNTVIINTTFLSKNIDTIGNALIYNDTVSPTQGKDSIELPAGVTVRLICISTTKWYIV